MAYQSFGIEIGGMFMRYTYVYLLEHIRLLDYDRYGSPINEIKTLGIFQKKELAKEAISCFLNLPGFSQFPTGFNILKKRLYYANPNSEFVYIVKNEYYDCENDYDVCTRCGFFDNIIDAENYIETLRIRSPFKKRAGDFLIGEMVLDKIDPFWADGFDYE